MRELTHTVTAAEVGCQIDTLLHRHFSLSSRLITELKHSGGILKNGIPVTIREPVKAGDLLTLRLVDETPSERILSEAYPLSVVYEDEDLLAVSKPKDMPIHPSQHHFTGTLGNAVMYRYRGEPYVFRPITRLDRDTTGIVLIARHKLAACRLSDQMQKGQIHKTYYALLSRAPEQAEGIVKAPIGRCPDSIIKRQICPEGKPAETAYQVISHRSDGSCVAKVTPLTGRTHQIRVHMAHIGCPLLYDYLYGTEIPGKTLFLHCGELSFVHPITGRPLVLRDPPAFDC